MSQTKLWQTNLFRLLLAWIAVSLILHFSWVLILAGFLCWSILLFTTAPGVFWTYLAYFSFDIARATHCLEKAVSHKPWIPQPYFTLGALYARQKKWPESIRLIKKAIELASVKKAFQFKISLGQAYRESGDYQKAVEIFEDLVAHNFGSLRIFADLALSYFKIGKYEKTLETAKTARIIDPTSTEPVLIIGMVHFAQQEFEAAKDDYQWVADRLQYPVESLYWLGRAELELGETEKAKEHLQLAAERIESDPLLANVTVEEAKEWLEKAGKG